MNWRLIRRTKGGDDGAHGAYTSLEELIRIQFQVSDFSLLPTQPVSSILSGRYASRLRGRGLNFEELRRYQPGDDVRNIDWKVTARTRTPHVRVYTEEKDRSVLLVLDQRLNMFFGTRDKFKSVTAAEIGAIAAWRAIGVGDRIGAIVFNDQDITTLAPKRSEQQVMSILATIVQFNHLLKSEPDNQPQESMLNHALQQAARIAHHDALIVVVSDFFGVDSQTEKLTAQLAVHNDVVALYPFDPSRLNPVPRKFVAGDGVLQVEVDLEDSSKRRKMIDDYGRELEQISHFLRKISAPLVMISNQGETAAQIRRALGVRPQYH